MGSIILTAWYLYRMVLSLKVLSPKRLEAENMRSPMLAAKEKYSEY